MDKTAITSFLGDLWRNRLSRYSLLFGVAGLLFFLALPVGSKYFLRQWLLDNGADTATIDKIRLNPFTGRFFLENVNVTSNGRTVLTNSTVFVNLGLRALFDKEALLQRATLTDTLIDIERYDDGSLRIGSYRTIPEGDRPVRQEGVPWVFRAREIGLSDVLIRYSGDGLHLNLRIDDATAERFTTDPEGASGTVDLEGKLNEAPLKLHLSVLRVSPDLDLKGELDCSGFPLGALAGMFGDSLSRLTGSFRADTDFTVKNGESELTATLQGKIGLADIDVAGSGWTGSGGLALDGGLGYISSNSGHRVAVDGLLIGRPISFAVPEHRLRLARAAVTLKGGTTIDIGEAVTVRSDAGLSLADTDFRLADLAVETGPGSWTGTVDFSSGKGGEPMRLIADGEIDLQDLLLSVPGTLELGQKQLKTEGVTRLSSGDSLKVGYEGSIGLANTGLKTESLSMQGDAITWQGVAAYAGSGRELQLKGSAVAERTAVELTEKKLLTSMGSLSLDSDAKLFFGGKPSYTGTASLSAADLHLADETGSLADFGRIAIDRFGGNNGTLTVDTVVTEGVNLPRSEILPVRMAIDRGELHNTVADESLNNVSFDELTVHNPSVTDDQGVPFVRLAALAFDNGTIRDQSVMHVANLRLDNGAFLFGPGESRQEPLIAVAGANGFPVSWSKEQGTRIEKVNVNNLVVRYLKEQAAQQESGPPAPEKPPGGSEGIPLRIDSVQVGGDSALHYTDPTLDPAFQTTFAIEALNVSNIDLNRPEEAMSYQLEAMVDKYAPLSLAGSFAPLASPFRLQQTGTLKNYSLHSISPFAIEAVGIALQSGQLDLTSDLTITGQELNSDNKLEIKNIEIAKKDAGRARSLESNLPVPLDVAIDMLSDRQGVITVSVPINGKLSDLQVGLQGIVVTALRKAIAQGIVPALAFTALGPTGALVYLGMKIGGSLIDTGLPMLQFAPNRSDLSAGQKAILNKVGAVLQGEMQDGSTTYSICPKVVPGETDEGGADRDTALTDEERRKELYRLGDKRAQVVRRYLVETFNLEESRLFICNPTLNYGESALGNVEFRK